MCIYYVFSEVYNYDLTFHVSWHGTMPYLINFMFMFLIVDNLSGLPGLLKSTSLKSGGAHRMCITFHQGSAQEEFGTQERR